MTLYINHYVEKMVNKAKITYDMEVGSWVGIVKELPGVYAQNSSEKAVRQELAEVIEEWVYLSLLNNAHVPGFKIPMMAQFKQRMQHA